jgi:hypothetical protein
LLCQGFRNDSNPIIPIIAWLADPQDLGFFRVIGYIFHSNIALDTDPILQLNIRGSYYALDGKDFLLDVVM